MAQPEAAVEERTATVVPVTVVDADVHPAPRSFEELREYVPEPWRSRKWPNQVFDAVEAPVYLAPNKSQRRDAWGPDGGPPCSDPGFTEKQLFAEAGVDYGMLFPLTVRQVANPEHEAAVCAATNAWLADTWLSKYNQHGRYFGTLRIPFEDPELSVREIERWGGHPAFKQIMILPHARPPLGQPFYYPIYEAAVRHNLVIALHVNRSPGMALLSPVGPLSYFIEHHSTYPLVYAPHVTSLIMEGVFEKFPSLKVVFVEGGFGWIVPLLWRLDHHWEELRAEVPWVKRRPSEYMREHIRFTTQPIEEPPKLQQLLRVLEWMDAEHTLMFATDYPHWDFDDPMQVLKLLPERMRTRILAENAIELYGLPPTRCAG